MRKPVASIDLSPLELVLTSPTAAFTKFGNESPELQARLGAALQASGLVDGINYIANTFGAFTNGSNNALVVNSRHFNSISKPALPNDAPALAMSTYRWNADLRTRVTGNYEEEIEINRPDGSFYGAQILKARVLKTNAPKLESAGKLQYIVDGINLPALRAAMPQFMDHLRRAQAYVYPTMRMEGNLPRNVIQ